MISRLRQPSPSPFWIQLLTSGPSNFVPCLSSIKTNLFNKTSLDTWPSTGEQRAGQGLHSEKTDSLPLATETYQEQLSSGWSFTPNTILHAVF